MERHLNKSKYGCPANRFSNGSGANLSDMSEGDLSNHHEGPVSLVSLNHEANSLVTILQSQINGTSH